MAWCLKNLFFLLFVRPVVFIFIGLHVRHRKRLPKKGPAIIIANHNSHLDTMVLMTVLPSDILSDIKPVAAYDYFCRNKLISWFSHNFIGIIPIKRAKTNPKEDLLEPCYHALDDNKIIILYPEGTRGEPEKMDKLKSGIARLAKRYPQIPIVPVFMHGMGKVLPKGAFLPVPFFCDVFVGESLYWNNDKQKFMDELEQSLYNLSREGKFPEWE